jgi:alkanesulfonate monooxygenase SsuD/methylene tetrahydromethanopterin reductase-like flavin-dependent oxidoreductase (luciferase family)
MRVGLSLNSAYAVDDPRDGVRFMLERVEAANEARLDSLFVGDHHVTGVPYYQNTVILARLLAEWDDRQSGALFLLPLWHPVLAAEQIGTLASIAAGPFVLQCALGGGPQQFAAMGVDMRRRVRDFEVGLDIIRRLLAGDRVTAEEPYPIQEAIVAPRPPEPVEVWIGADVDKAIGRAARLGDAWYAGPNLTVAEATTKLAHYKSRCEADARTPTCYPIRRDVYVGSSADDAARIRSWTDSTGYRGMDPSALVIGTPDDVTDYFRGLADLGFTDVVIRQLAPDQSDAVASMRRLGEVRQAL